jgi:flagellum-specific ATP synthase
LSRRLAAQSHYPAVDVLDSISRLMPDLVSAEQQRATATIRQLLAAHRDHEDLISIGAYRAGTNAKVDTALAMQEAINGYLRQPIEEGSSIETSREQLIQLVQRCSTLPLPPSQTTDVPTTKT